MTIHEKLHRLGILFQDVSEYDIKKEGSQAVDLAESIADTLNDLEMQPFTIAPNKDGISIVFIDPCQWKYATIEVFHDGAIIVTTITGCPPDTVYDINSVDNIDDLPYVIIGLKDFLGVIDV